MSRAFDGARRIVLAGGRRFVCRPPTVRTVDRVLGAFAAEIVAVHTAARDVPLTAEEVLRVFAGDRRLPEILETCVELWGGAPGELAELLAEDRDLQLELAGAVVGLCDTDAIVASLHLDKLFADLPPAEGAEDPDAIMCRVAAAFGVVPHSLLDWPYAAFVRVLELGYGSALQAPEPEHQQLTLADLEA